MQNCLNIDFIFFINDWLIDFSGILNCLGLFYAWRLKNNIHYKFLFAFIV